MGLHSARRSHTAASSLAGKGILTAAAAMTLLGGGTGMAFAGEAPADAGHGTEHVDHQGDHGKKDHKDDKGCEIPIVDDASEQADAAVNEATGDATKSTLEAGNEAIAPAHDAVCPPINDVLGGPESKLPSTDDAKTDLPKTDGVKAPEAPAGTLPV